MTTTWTAEQILGLAPDPGAARAARGLATPRPWQGLGRHEQAAWGECRGSSAQPYQTQIDLSEPAFKCSCPSRKLPCKHALGLFLLLADTPAAFGEAPPPAWVGDWLAGRARRAQQRAARAERDPEAEPTAPQAAAQVKRAADREAKVAAGLVELEQWLADLMRRGLGSLPTEPPAFWERPATRLVDAQAPGLARLVRELAGLPASGEGWPARLLERLGRLHLLVEGYQRLAALPPATQADIRALIGWALREEDLLAEPGLTDRWLVVGQRVDVEERLRVQRTWLLGEASGRAALILQFAHGTLPFPASLPTGVALDAELVFYPGAYPLRALIKRRDGPPAPLAGLPGHDAIDAALAAYAAALALNPWLEEFPFTLRSAWPVHHPGGWAIRDAAGHSLPLARRFQPRWPLLALSAGHPLALFGEWDGDAFLPLAASADGRFTAF